MPSCASTTPPAARAAAPAGTATRCAMSNRMRYWGKWTQPTLLLYGTLRPPRRSGTRLRAAARAPRCRAALVLPGGPLPPARAARPHRRAHHRLGRPPRALTSASTFRPPLPAGEGGGEGARRRYDSLDRWLRPRGLLPARPRRAGAARRSAHPPALGTSLCGGCAPTPPSEVFEGSPNSAGRIRPPLPLRGRGRG